MKTSKVIRRNVKRLYKSTKYRIKLFSIYFKYTDFMFSFLNPYMIKNHNLFNRIKYYFAHKKRNYKPVLKKCLYAFIILNIVGCFLSIHYAEQNKKASYNHMIVTSKLNHLYKTTNFTK